MGIAGSCKRTCWEGRALGSRLTPLCLPLSNSSSLFLLSPLKSSSWQYAGTTAGSASGAHAQVMLNQDCYCGAEMNDVTFLKFVILPSQRSHITQQITHEWSFSCWTTKKFQCLCQGETSKIHLHAYMSCKVCENKVFST